MNYVNQQCGSSQPTFPKSLGPPRKSVVAGPRLKSVAVPRKSVAVAKPRAPKKIKIDDDKDEYVPE